MKPDTNSANKGPAMLQQFLQEVHSKNPALSPQQIREFVFITLKPSVRDVSLFSG